MLDENALVDAVCDHLERRRFSITQRLTTRQKGVDIIASRGRTIPCIEAKGASSSREGSPRHGKGFQSAQVAVRISRAVYTALQMAEENPRARIAVAFPSLPRFRLLWSRVENQLYKLNVGVFWVDQDGQVSAPKWV